MRVFFTNKKQSLKGFLKISQETTRKYQQSDSKCSHQKWVLKVLSSSLEPWPNTAAGWRSSCCLRPRSTSELDWHGFWFGDCLLQLHRWGQLRVSLDKSRNNPVQNLKLWNDWLTSKCNSAGIQNASDGTELQLWFINWFWLLFMCFNNPFLWPKARLVYFFQTLESQISSLSFIHSSSLGCSGSGLRSCWSRSHLWTGSQGPTWIRPDRHRKTKPEKKNTSGESPGGATTSETPPPANHAWCWARGISRLTSRHTSQYRCHPSGNTGAKKQQQQQKSDEKDEKDLGVVTTVAERSLTRVETTGWLFLKSSGRAINRYVQKYV